MSQAHFTSYTRQENQAPILVLEGTIDLATTELAGAALERFMAEKGPAIVVDASRVNFIDSKGLGTLLKAAKAARDAGGQLALHNPSLPVTKIVEACGLSGLFPPPPEAPPPAEPAASNGAARAATASRAGTRRA
jgi:anti-anti-sigma factor